MSTLELCERIQRTRESVPGADAVKVFGRLLPRVQDAWRRTGLADAWLIAPAKSRRERVMARERELDVGESARKVETSATGRRVAA